MNKTSKNLLILSLLISTSTILYSCSGEMLKDKCNCELSGQEVFLDYKGEYYWIEIDNETELKTFGPYSNPEHGYAAIKRCEELARECDNEYKDLYTNVE